METATYVPRAGQSVEEASKEMVSMANRLGQDVMTTLNGVGLIVAPDPDEALAADLLVRQYYRAKEREANGSPGKESEMNMQKIKGTARDSVAKAKVYRDLLPERTALRLGQLKLNMPVDWRAIGEARAAALAVARGEVPPTHGSVSRASRPTYGYWDGRHDFATGTPDVCGVEVWEPMADGRRVYALIRHNSTDTCPAGPCGICREVVTYVTDQPIEFW